MNENLDARPETYEIYEPDGAVDGDWTFWDQRDDKQGYRIRLWSPDHILTVRLASVILILSTDEEYRGRSCLRMWETNAECSGVPGNGFFRVVNSKLAKWQRSEAIGIIGDGEELVHYAIFTWAVCFDFLTLRPPAMTVSAVRRDKNDPTYRANRAPRS